MCRWSSYDEFSADNFVLLCKKQKNLKCIEVGVMKGSLTEALHAHPDLIKNLEQLHALDLYPETVDCLEACHKVIQSTPKLDQLLIESAATTINADGQWDDESNKPGLITSTLFKDKLPFQSCTPMSLKFLSLNRINLRWAAQTYMKVIQFPNLEELEIRCCLGADALFAEMSKPAKRPDKLECLTYVQAADGRTLQYIQSSLENFLQSISTLKKLYVNFVDGNNLPKVEAICNHAGTLKSLILHSSHLSVGSFLSYRTYSKEYFARLCKECTKLEQLAIALPANNVLEENFSDNFLEYLVSQSLRAPIYMSQLTRSCRTLSLRFRSSSPFIQRHGRRSRSSAPVVRRERFHRRYMSTRFRGSPMRSSSGKKSTQRRTSTRRSCGWSLWVTTRRIVGRNVLRGCFVPSFTFPVNWSIHLEID